MTKEMKLPFDVQAFVEPVICRQPGFQQIKVRASDAFNCFLNIAVLQDKLNEKVVPGWTVARNAWPLAILAETIEGLNWTNWEWWKPGQMNLGQVQIEIIDVLHFVTSKLLELNGLGNGNQWINDSAIALTAGQLFESYARQDDNKVQQLKFTGNTDEERQAKALQYFFKKLVRYVADEDLMITEPETWAREVLTYLFRAVTMSGMDLVEMYSKYVAKNALNFFRKDNGYKQGTYIKFWPAGQDKTVEDNDYLMENVLPYHVSEKNPLMLMNNLYSALHSYYQQVVLPAQPATPSVEGQAVVDASQFEVKA